MVEANRAGAAPQAGERPRWRIVAFLVAVTALLFMATFGTIMVVSGWGPELMADAPGGTVYVSLHPFCRSPLAAMREGPCFSEANLSVAYGGHEAGPFPARDASFSLNGDIALEEARATLRIDTDLGTWTREVWLTESTGHEFQIEPSSPQTAAEVVGRQAGYALFFGIATVFAGALLIAAALWFVRGTMAAAEATRGLLVFWLLGQVVLLVMALAGSGLGFLPLLFAGWLWFLWRLTHDWVLHMRKRESPPREERPPPAAGPVDA